MDPLSDPPSEPSPAPSKAVILVRRRGEEEYQYASRLVWWIARLVDWTQVPAIGDTVVEVTHLIGLSKAQLGLHAAIGELLAIEDDKGFPDGKTYVIRDIEGKEQRWTNAKMCVVERGTLPSPSPSSNP